MVFYKDDKNERPEATAPASLPEAPKAPPEFLMAARKRGEHALGVTAVAPEMSHVTAYIGLISSALELGKLIATEERDLRAIDSHHEREITQIKAAFEETENAMQLDFEREKGLREEAFKAIHALIAAGQPEIAKQFFEMLSSNFKRPALELILENRNLIASQNTRLTLK